MTSPDAPEPTAFEAQVRALLRLARLVDKATSRQQRIDRLGDLIPPYEEVRQKMYDVRDGDAAEIFTAESLSLAKLADRVGVSKARAAQIMKDHKKATTEEAPDE